MITMPKLLRVVLADDERPARRFLINLLKTFPDVEVVGEAANGTDAIDLIESQKPDLALLDLNMPEAGGLDVARLVKAGATPSIAFVTAYDEFAVQAFELNAIDYLLKPVERERLATTLDRARTRAGGEPSAERAQGLTAASAALDTATRRGYLERIPVRRRDETVILPVRQIASVVAEGDLLHLTTADQRALHHLASPARARVAARPAAVRAPEPRHAGGGRSDPEGQPDAGRHLPGAVGERPDAVGQPHPGARAARHPAADLIGIRIGIQRSTCLWQDDAMHRYLSCPRAGRARHHDRLAARPSAQDFARAGAGAAQADAADRRAQRLPVGAARARSRPRLQQGRDLQAGAVADDRHPAPAPGRRRRAVLVGLHAVDDEGPGSGPRHAGADRHRASHDEAVARDVRDGLHGRRRRAVVQGRPHRLADRHGGRPFDRRFAAGAAHVLRPRRALHDADPQRQPALGRCRRRQAGASAACRSSAKR